VAVGAVPRELVGDAVAAHPEQAEGQEEQQGQGAGEGGEVMGESAHGVMIDETSIM
jgi:hypothetical protein